MRILLVFTLITTVLVATGCKEQGKGVPLIFSVRVPKSRKMQQDLEALEQSKRLKTSDRKAIEQDIAAAQRGLGVPEGILWCLLYSKSQFDFTKNMNSTALTKGIGQLTETALSEINLDRDYYDPRTSVYFKRHLRLGDSPVNFITRDSTPLEAELSSPASSIQNLDQSQAPQSMALNRNQNLELAANSYFRIPIGVFASASYLNNRYQQLRSALDHLAISYDPVILWFFAAAAYESGTRSIYSLFTHELMSRGDKSLSHILSDMGAAHQYLTQKENLEYPLRASIPHEVDGGRIQSLTQTMENIMSCVLPENQVL